MQRSQTEKKREGCDLFDSVSKGSRTDVKSLHAGRESEGYLSWYAGHCVCHSTFVFAYLGILRVVRHARSTGSSLSFHNWHVHSSVMELGKELDVNRAHRQRVLGLRRGVDAVGVVMLLLMGVGLSS